jgi:hypothetical protein
MSTTVVSAPMPILQERARAAIKQHGGLRKAAKALGINHSTLLYLAEGKRTNASARTLQALGVKRMFRANGTESRA